jgi:hypothetical protein
LYAKALYPDQINPVGDPDLDPEFTLEELDIAICKLSTKKATGTDNIPNEVWKSLSLEQKYFLLDSYNHCWNTRIFPEAWSEIVMTPIFKKGDKKLPENYRPISLLNTGMKLYTMLLCNRLNDWCEEHAKISDYQAAYRKNYGCEDHIFVLNSAIQANISKKRKLYALFIDLSKAFDSVRHDKLWAKLKSAGLSYKFISNVQQLYTNVKAKIRTKFGDSDYFPINNSVFQGETLSPKLFSLFIEDIVSTLRNSGISSVKIGLAEIDILLYADDMVILAYNVFDLQCKIDIIRKYFKENDLTVNLSKTKVMIFRLGKSNFCKPKIFWGDEEIEIVDTYVYLGVPFNSNMNYNMCGGYFVQKGMQAQRELFSLFYKANIYNISVRLQLFDSLVKSVLLYCSHVWGVKFLNNIKSFQMQFLRKLFCLPKYTQHWFLMMESHSHPIELSLVKNILFFWTKIMARNKLSLIRKCYDHLQTSQYNPKMKLNWFRDVRTLLEPYNCAYFLDILELNEAVNVATVRKDIISKIVNSRNVLDQEMIIRMRNSRKMPLYQKLKTHFVIDQIMNSNCNWNLICLYVQLKSNIPRICVKNRTVNLNALKNYFDQNSYPGDELCTLCTLGSKEDLYHFLYKCPAYSLIRLEMFKSLQTPATEEETIMIVSKLSSNTLRCILNFIEKALEIRDEWISLYL